MRIGGSVPYSTSLACDCFRGDCDMVRFDPGAFDAVLEDGAAEVLAIMGNYRNAIASKKAGSLTFRQEDDRLVFELELAEGPRADDLREVAKGILLLARPVFDQDRSSFIESAGVATFSAVYIRALLLGATDRDEGWQPVTVE